MCSANLNIPNERSNKKKEISERRVRRSILLIKCLLDITETQGIGRLYSHSCIIPGEELSVHAINNITYNGNYFYGKNYP